VGFDQVTLGNMQVDHGRGNVGMSQQLFKRDDVNPLFEQVCGIGMP